MPTLSPLLFCVSIKILTQRSATAIMTWSVCMQSCNFRQSSRKVQKTSTTDSRSLISLTYMLAFFQKPTIFYFSLSLVVVVHAHTRFGSYEMRMTRQWREGREEFSFYAVFYSFFWFIKLLMGFFIFCLILWSELHLVLYEFNHERDF